MKNDKEDLKINKTEIMGLKKYKTKIMSSINRYKSSVDTTEESISEAEDKPEENIYKEQRIKQVENTEVRIRRKILPNKMLEMKEEIKNKKQQQQINKNSKYVGKSKVKVTVQSNTVNICYS